MKCKSYGHPFNGNAHRIKEHVFKIPGNVSACKNPPRGIEEKFPEWALKARRMNQEGKKKGGFKMMPPPSGRDVKMTFDDQGHLGGCSQDVQESQPATPAYNQGGCYSAFSGGCSSNPTTSSSNTKRTRAWTGAEPMPRDHTLHQAFDKQWLLELHLKWTQAFIACGIPFNVMKPYF